MKYIFASLCLFTVGMSSLADAQEDLSQVLTNAALRSPAVAAVLDTPREQPAEVLAAVFTLLDLREFEVAAEVFKTIGEANLSAADQAALVREFGTAKFLMLAREAVKHDIAGAREFAQSALAASAAEATKPERIRSLIADLASDDVATREIAGNDLAASGFPAAQAVLEALAVSSDKAQRSHLFSALVEIRPLVDPLIIAALGDGKGQFRRDAVELAGQLHLLEAVPWLATIASGSESNPDIIATAQTALLRMGLTLPDSVDALATVKRELERVDAGIPTDSLPNEPGLWWSFDPATNKFSSVELIECERRSLIHARLAANLLVLPTATAADRHLAIISAIEAANILGVQPSPEIEQLATSLPTHELNAALDDAIKTNRVNAAIACANLLAERADLASLQSHDSSPTPLNSAVAHPNMRLKFAALTAIMKIQPAEPFPGSSYVPEALWQFAAGAGDQQAIVGSSTVTRANDWAGNLRALGYDATPVATGRELLRHAVNSPRLALILVDSDIGQPLVREVIYQLRSQPKLSHTPVAVLTSNSDAHLGQELASIDKHLLSVPRPRSPEAAKSVVDRLLALAGPQQTPEERTSQAMQAIEWIGQLLEGGSHYDELLREASILERTVFNPTLTEASLKALANVGTASSQKTLVDFASMNSQPVELRQLAVQSFAASRERFGVLLSSSEIALQYDRYNASETASAEEQQLFGLILDALEKKL